MQEISLFMQNHWMLCLAGLFVLFLLIIVEFLRLKRGTQRISPSQLTMLLNRQNAIVVDIRNEDAFKTGHIAGATSIPFADWETKSKKLSKLKTQPIVLVCATGLESARAANALVKQDLKPLILAGGIRGWRDADMPLIKG